MTGSGWAPWRARPGRPDPTPSGDALLEADGVGVRLGGREVLAGVDLVVRAGEALALVGPNGAGKSTLLGALTGDIPCVAGEVRCGDRPVGAWTPAELALRRAVLPQQATVTFPFTVEQVVRMGRAPWVGLPEEDADDEIVAGAMADADVAHLAARSVPTLSGGERARVAFARMLAQATPLLLCDEPTAALDLHHQELTLQLVRARLRAGAGAVLVLHDLDQAAAYADRVAILDSGRVVVTGRPAEVLTEDRLCEVYRHPVEVVVHDGALLIRPSRRGVDRAT